MARKATFTRDEIIAKALQMVRKDGIESVTARSLGAALGVSSSPIFTHFKSMDEVMLGVESAAKKIFDDYVQDVVDYMPAFKEFGMRLVRFAREEPKLFSYLFLHIYPSNTCLHPVAQKCLEGIGEAYGFSKDQTDVLFRQLWTLACGLAVMGSTHPDTYNEEVVSQMLSCQFSAMMCLLKSGTQVVNITPHKRIEGEPTILKL